ncbi:uncharacterized protein LOC113790626 isoform X2 [Dermatophagoides pteronyssinus]|uniref:uncharacterized protein LOC113790626 isoform X2 n=1 Tax=Dermatophagoides pteronyssinus TaxID=6956 RepID=UPI003F663117
MDDKRNEIKSTIMNRIQMINNEMNKKSSQQSKNDNNIQNRRWNYANTNAIRTLERQQQKQQKSSQIIESSISNEPNKKMSTINSDSLKNNDNDYDDDVGDHNNRKEIIDNNSDNSECHQEISNEPIEEISPSSSSSSSSFSLKDGENNDNSGSSEIIMKNVLLPNNDENTDSSSTSSPAFYTITKPTMLTNFSFDSSATTMNTNLRPILKRKDSLDKSTVLKNQPDPNLPPPILKKRDSSALNIDGNIISSAGNDSSSSTLTSNVATLCLQQPPPPSILKNRQQQPRGSYSFDETLNINTDVIGSTSDDPLQPHYHQQQPYHLKPILKKKSWSTESGPDHFGHSTIGSNSNNDHQVKGILKSSSIDRSPPQQSSPTGSSLLTATKNSSNFDERDPGTTVSYLYSHSTTNEQSTTTTSFSSNKFFSPSNNLSTAGLKSILKSSSSSTVASRQNRLRSTSLSPTASTDSLSLLSSNTDESEESSSSLVINNNRKSAFRKRASLDGNLIVNSIGGNDESSSKPLFRLFNKNKNDEISVINQATIQSSSSSSSMATETIIKPILKSNLRSDNSGNNCQNQQHQCLNDNESVQSTCLDSNDIDDNSMSSSSSSSSLAATSLMEMIHTLPDNNDINNDNNNEQSSSTMRIMSTTASSSPTTATATTSMDTVIALRFQASPTSSSRINSSNINNKIVRKVRPKSCFVIGVADDNHHNDGNIDDDGGGSTTISISERLAKLKQNGEYGWRQRIIPRDQQQSSSSSSSTTTTKSMLKSTNSLKSDTKEIKIANRLSALMDSQSQWRARVPEKDAKKFTVASKLSTTNTNNTPTNDKSNDNDGMDKVVLRETPKRHGLRGSTLSEKKLGAISLKLNTVLGKDKNPFSSPSQRSPISKTKSNNNDDGNGNNNQTSSLEQSTNATNEISQPETIMILKPDDEESFGSFFGFDSNRMNELLKPSSPALSTTTPLDNDKEQQSYSLSTLDTTTSTIKLLSESKKTRVQAPRRRRQATGKNPLARASIAIDSYQTSSSTTISSSGVTNGTIHMDDDSKISSSSPISSTPRTPSTPITKDDSRFALSALAGLASVEDFKSVANKLRSNNSVVRNDSWRTFDLKNSLQSKMLILIKGRRKAHTRLIEPRWQSLNQMDSFILVTKDKIIAYIGRYSNIIERTKCMEISDLIRKRKDLCFRSSSNGVTLIDCQNDLNLSNNSILMDRLMPLLQELNFIIENDVDQFEKSIGLTILNLDLDEDDEFYEEFINHSNIVYQVVFDEKSDAEKAQLRPLENNCGRQPRHAILQPDKALVFDFGSEMYIWLGKSVSNIIRKKAVEAAKDYWYQGYDYTEFDCCPLGNNITIKSDRRPDWAWFIRVNQNMEPILFKDKFFNWPAFTLTRPEKKYQSRKSSLSSSTTITTNNDDAKKHKCCKKDLSAELNLFPVDVEKDMIQNVPQQQELILECVSLGRGAGDTIHDEDGLPVKVITLDVQCFVIDECGDRVELNEMDKNFLCSSESYYIRWKYRLTRISRCLKTGGESRYSVEQHGGRDRVCYFVWQGKDTRNTQRGITALNAIEKLRVEGASQTYVEHGQEDPIFLRIFQGSLVIQNGKRKQTNNCGSYRMFMLKDTLPEEQFMIELECSFRNLRSRISYAFVNPGHSSKIYLWHGCKTNESERLKIRTFFDTNILKHRSQEFGFPVDDLINDYHLIDLDEGRETREFMNIFQQQQQILSPDSTLTRRQSKSNLHRDVYFSLIDDNRHYCFTPRLFHFRTSSDRIFESIEIISSYYPPKSARATIHISYPFVQDDIYGRAKTRPTFFLFDAEYEVYLWESKYPFFISSNQTTMKNEHQQNQNKSPVDDDDDDGGGDERRQQMPKMIDIEEEIQSECNMTTGFAAQLWLAERKCALETTLAYCHAKNPAEPPKSYVISAGLEPDSFCGLFPTWTYYDNVAKLHIQDGRKPGEQILVQEVLSQMEDINQSTYSYEELKRRPLPEGINILCLESYLDDEEFEKVFSMNREEFCSLPTWKQKLIKQEKELF